LFLKIVEVRDKKIISPGGCGRECPRFGAVETAERRIGNTVRASVELLAVEAGVAQG
jgi:hypothetical protein